MTFMDTTARLRYTRLSPRKVKLVIDLVRGLSVTDALHQLKVMPQGAAAPVAKLVSSATANAKHNHKLEEEKLWIKSIQVGQGPVLKRFTPRAQGRATPIRRPTAHLTVVVTDDVKPKRAKR